jgi:hypothetical protein
MLPLIRLITALEILLAPVWVAGVFAGVTGPVLGRLARAAGAVVAVAAALAAMAAASGEDGAVVGVLRGQAVACGWTVLLAGFGAMWGRMTGPRAAQALTALTGWLLVAAMILAGPAAELTGGAVQETIVRATALANPLLAAEKELDLPWLHQDLTYRLTPLGESYGYLLGDLSWTTTLAAHVFVGSGLMVFALPKRRRRRAG